MNQLCRDKVDTYLRFADCSPLVFKRHDIPINTKFNITEVYTLKDAICGVLENTRIYTSYSINGGWWETLPDCYRSVFDIWRHLLVDNPELTIHEVMAEIYKDDENRGELFYSHYCAGVRKRVFKLAKYLNLSSHVFSHIYDKDYRDEFDLVFQQWNLLI